MRQTIYKQNGEIRAVIEPSDNSTWQYGIMADNVLSLSFTLYEFVKLEVNDYIIFEETKFELDEDYRPEMASTIEYKYSVKFYGIEHRAKNALVIKTLDGENETSFSLTDNAAVHGQLFVDNLNRITGTRDWVLGEVVESVNITILYDCISVWEGLNKLAEEADSEWWFEGTTLNISRCEHGDLLELGYLRGLKSISKVSNDNAPFFTRLYPIGSSRNIVKSEYGYSRLRLPGGATYVEQNTHLGIVEYSEEAAFSHIFPRYTGKVGTVRSEEVKDTEGNPFTIYYFTDPGLPFDPSEKVAPGQVLSVVFQGGQLNGYDFEADFHPETGEWEIVTQFPNEDTQLPGGYMIPNPGDDYIPYNMIMPTEYYPRAEQELRDAVDEFLARHAIDVAIYKAPSNYLYFREHGIKPKLGRRVRLFSDEYFEEGYRDSRVIQITRKVNNPDEMDLEFSYAVKIGRITQLENNVVDIQTAFKEQLNKEVLTVLKSWDSADPTEYNVLSAVRTIRAISNSLSKLAEESDRKYLFKDREDEAAELITFLKGIEVVGEALIDRLTVDNEAMFRKTLSSEKFVSGFPAGTGWALFWNEIQNAAGVIEKKSSLEIDEVTVRGAMRIYEMIISQLSGENGTRLTTDQMRVASIDLSTNTIYLDTEKGVLYNPFRAGDIVMVQRYNGMPTASNDYNLVKQYEFEVTEVGIGSGDQERVDWIRFDNFVGDLANVTPRDVLTRVDSVTDINRKGLIKHTSVEPGSPYIDIIYGMKTDPDDAVKTRLGRLSGIIDYWWGQLSGYGLFSDNVYLRGDFMLRTGDSVETLFEIVEGMLRSAMQRITYNLTEEDNFFTNASFTNDMEGWIHESDMALYMIEDEFINIGSNLLCEKNSLAEVVEHDGRQMLRIKDSYIRQQNEYIRKPEEDSILYIGFRYVCKEDGVLKIGFDGTEEESDFEIREVKLASSPEYRTFEIDGQWDGEGDFLLEFSGDIYIEHLSLSNRPLEDYKKQVSTLFEQTDEYIKAVAKEVNDLEGYVKEAGWITEADGHKWWASITSVDELGNKLTTHESSFHVTASAISAIVTRIDKVEDEFSSLDSYVRSAGWITAADGHKLWATITRVDLLGNEVTTHKASFHVTAEKIQSIVTSLEENAEWQSKMEQTADRISLSINSGSGKILYKDLTFKEGVNSTALYNNSGGTGVIYERVAKTSDVPTDSTHMMRVTFIYGTSASPGLGGFRWGNASRANAVFEAHILAKIPAGYTLEFASNAYGTGSKLTWLSSQAGTGGWETYVCRVECGSTGSFSTTNYFYINGVKPTVQYSTNGTTWTSTYSESAVYVRIYNETTKAWGSAINLTTNPNANKLMWYVGSATVYDLHIFEDVVSEINLTPGEIKIKADKISLEGLVTMNNYVKITTAGKLIAVDGEFSGKISANSGTIGGFTISGSYIGAAGSGTASSSSANSFSISPSLICYGNSKMWVGMGSYVFPATGSGLWNCPMRISMSTPAYGSSDYNWGNIGMYISVSGKLDYDDVLDSGNHALYIPSGFISGFRLRARRLSSSTTLTAQDNWIFGIGTNGDYTLTLPSSPKEGQIYFIRKVTSGNIIVKTGSTSHKIRRNWNSEATSVTIKDGNLAIFMWDRLNLYWTNNYCSWL